MKSSPCTGVSQEYGDIHVHDSVHVYQMQTERVQSHSHFDLLSVHLTGVMTKADHISC